jgi:hypothetical protein
MTWWDNGLRSPQDALGGVKMLAREVDKVRADLTGAFEIRSAENEALLDEAFFSSLGTSKDQLTDVIRAAWITCRQRNKEALGDLRESVENEPEITDSQFMTEAEASDVDNAVVCWVFETLQVTPDAIERINRTVEQLAPSGQG